MKLFPWQGRLALIFLIVAIAFNCLHYAIFNDSNYIFKFILAQLGFLPISVYLVTVVINQLLRRREKQAILKKLYMVIGSFFSEIGNQLLQLILQGDIEKETNRKHLQINQDWTGSNYVQAKKTVGSLNFTLSHSDLDWQELRTFLSKEKPFLLGLLGNPNLLEHESFTELLWAITHLSEELSCRENIDSLSQPDCEHLIGDVKRVYLLLVDQWLAYMQHLHEDYPYLFSLAVRTNPFNPDAKAEF